MTVKLSSPKVSRLLRMYLHGFTQAAVCQKLGVSQSTVSLYVSEFAAAVDEEGLEAAAEEFGIMDVVKELHSLGAELKKANLTVEDAKKGLKAAIAFEECGVPQEGYKDVVVTYSKVQAEGFLPAAMKLQELEEGSGMSYEEMLGQAEACHAQLLKEKSELSATEAKVSQAKQVLSLLQQQMKKAEMDNNRLEKVETLAAALKKGGVTDKELDGYIQRQSLLNKSGVSWNTFGQILDAAQVSMAQDAGKGLLKKLTEYGGLEATIVALKKEKQSLESQTKDLGDKAKMRGALQAEVTKLQAQKGESQGALTAIKAQYGQIYYAVEALKAEWRSLSDKVTNLKTTHAEQQALNQSLTQDIETKQKRVADLKEIESKRQGLLHELSEIEAKVSARKMEWNIFLAFVGVLRQRSLAELEKFLVSAPRLIELAKGGKYAPDLIMKHVFGLLGPELQILKCSSCGIRCTVDRAEFDSDCHCPSGEYRHNMHVDKSAMEVLQDLVKPRPIKITRISIAPPKEQQ